MVILAENPPAEFADALKRHVDLLQAGGPGWWRFELKSAPGRKRLKGTARLEDRWVLFRAAVQRFRARAQPSLRRLELMLRANAALVGGARFALADDLSQAWLSAEIPVEPSQEFDADARIASAIEGFRQGAVRLAAKGRSTPPDRTQGRVTAGIAAAEHDWATLVEEAGWPFSERPDGRQAVELEVGAEDYRQAVIEPEGGGLRVSANLEAGAPSAEAARAICLLLLWASRRVRMARPYAAVNGAVLRWGWEVRFDRLPAAWELDHALASLSVALRLTGRESEALEDQRVARQFLRIMGIV